MSISTGDQTICKYNLRGMCRFGQRCRNLHEDPEESVERMLEDSSAKNKKIDKSLTAPKRRTTGANHPSRRNFRKDQPGTSAANVSQARSRKPESEEKTCGICFDVVLQKVERMEQTFGILPNCNHVFCFACIRKWRQSKEFEFEVSKSCPECRVASDFVYPAKYWIDNKEDKEKFIKNHKDRMKKMNCKYFRQGGGTCPFGNTCLYLHALPNGELKDVGPPKPRRRPTTMSGEDLVHQILYWLNDDEYDFEDSDDSDEDSEGLLASEFLLAHLDFEDPCIAHNFSSLERSSTPLFFG